MGVSFGHINIRTSRLAETIDFYRTVLGLEPGDAATMADQSGNAWLFDEGGAPIIHLNAPKAGEAIDPAVTGALDHVAFNCDDMAAMQMRLGKAGIAYDVFETRVPGLVQINLRDPNGVKVELAFGAEAARRPA